MSSARPPGRSFRVSNGQTNRMDAWTCRAGPMYVEGGAAALGGEIEVNLP